MTAAIAPHRGSLGIIEPMRATRALVGRTAELERAVTALGLTEDAGGVLVLSGDAGIGKTRLLREVAGHAERAGWSLAVGHCVAEAGADLPYLPFAELITSLRDRVPDLIDELTGSHPALAHLLAGNPGRDRVRASTGPALLAEAVHAALTSAATRHGVLAVIEDAHWADHSSRDLLTLLMTRGFSGPVGLVVSYRSDDLHRRHPLHATLGVWARLSEVTRLHLDPLPDPTMADLVHDLTDADEDAVARIVERAAGNPFFAEELVASGNELGTDLGRVLRTRFEQLDAGTRTVVRAAAVMGRPLDHDLLQAVVDLSPDDLDAALASAIDQHILERVGGDAYGFRHALVAEAIGDDLLPGQRRRLHAAFATALRAHPSLCTASDLARHAAASGDLETAVTAGIDAGESAWSLGGPREAATLFEQVLDWMTDDDPRRDDATAQAALAAAASGDVTRGVHLVRDRLAHSRAEDAARARLLAAYVTLARLLEDPSEVPGLLDRAREALRLTEGLTDRSRLQAMVAEIQALADADRYLEAAAASEAALRLADELDATDLATDVRTILVAWDVAEADLPRVEARLLELVRDHPLDDPTHVRAYYRLALVEHSRGNPERSLEHLDAATGIADRLHRPWGVFESASRRLGATIAWHLGRFDDALDRLEVPGPPFPQPGHAEFLATRLAVLTARDWTVGPELFDAVLPYWPDDALLALTSMTARIELLGRQGKLDGVPALVDRAVAVMERQWGPHQQALLRIAAVLTGIIADAGPLDTDLRRTLGALRGRLTDRAREVLAANQALGAESRAWAKRLEAEELHLAWADSEGVEESALVGAWRAAVAAFDDWGDAYQAARCRIRLATVLAAAGDLPRARAEADLVTEAARRLPSEPLTRLLAAVPGLNAAPRASQQDLTAREQEILHLLALGRSNGQIGKQLFISTKTASVHVSNILAKLGVRSRGAAVAVARETGLL